MTSLNNQLSNQWGQILNVMFSAVVLEDRLKNAVRKFNSMSQDFQLLENAMIALAKQFSAAFIKCYDPKVTLEEIIQIAEKLSESTGYDLEMELTRLYEIVRERVSRVNQLKFVMNNPSCFTAEETEEIVDDVLAGLIPPFTQEFLGEDFGVWLQSKEEILKKIKDAETLRGLRFKVCPNKPKHCISDPVTYRFLGGKSDRPVTNASFYSAAYICNQLSEQDGLEPVYKFIQQPQLGSDEPFSRVEKIEILTGILEGKITVSNSHDWEMERQMKFQPFILCNCLGNWWAGEKRDSYDFQEFDLEEIEKYLAALKQMEDIPQLIGHYDIQIVKKANGYRIADWQDCNRADKLLYGNRVDPRIYWSDRLELEDCDGYLDEEYRGVEDDIEKANQYTYSKKVRAIKQNMLEFDRFGFGNKNNKTDGVYSFKVIRKIFITRKQLKKIK
jgi:hypothetical protein